MQSPAALKRGDLSETEMIEHADAVWESLPGTEAEKRLHRQLVTREQFYAAEPAPPEEARMWLARTQETGRLFDEDSFGMQQYFLGPDGRVYRRDPAFEPPKPLLDAYMMSVELRHQAAQARNRRGVNERDPEIIFDLIMEAHGKLPPDASGRSKPPPRVD
ncbi:MAG: hypothetical protein RIB45_14245 [Marivibrio sp.]|uniref:hypothetical protein n=1 Tax=Marivibrio sp. TaxID=2039719 RepID=UPI0032EED22D